MERMLARVGSFQAKMDDTKEMLSRMEAKTDVNLKEMEQEMRTNRAKTEANHERIMAKLTPS